MATKPAWNGIRKNRILCYGNRLINRLSAYEPQPAISAPWQQPIRVRQEGIPKATSKHSPIFIAILPNRFVRVSSSVRQPSAPSMYPVSRPPCAAWHSSNKSLLHRITAKNGYRCENSEHREGR